MNVGTASYEPMNKPLVNDNDSFVIENESVRFGLFIFSLSIYISLQVLAIFPVLWGY